jgi:hypothetical protein
VRRDGRRKAPRFDGVVTVEMSGLFVFADSAGVVNERTHFDPDPVEVLVLTVTGLEGKELTLESITQTIPQGKTHHQHLLRTRRPNRRPFWPEHRRSSRRIQKGGSV